MALELALQGMAILQGNEGLEVAHSGSAITIGDILHLTGDWNDKHLGPLAMQRFPGFPVTPLETAHKKRRADFSLCFVITTVSLCLQQLLGEREQLASTEVKALTCLCTYIILGLFSPA